MSLDRRALLVHIHVRTWSARKFDRSASNEVTTAKNADPQAARVNKHLLGGKEDSHAAVTAAAAKLRETHYRLTLPWRDTGWRLLPTKLWSQYTSEIKAAIAQFQVAVNQFVQNYTSLRGTAALKMGDLFNPADYPSDVNDRFGVQLSHMPVPSAGDFRLELDEARVAQIQDETRQQVESGLKSAMEDAWRRLHDVVARMADKLEDPKGIFRDSMLENLKSMVELTKDLNLIDDPELETVRQSAQQLLYPPDALRKNPEVRADAAARARALAERMKGVFA